MINRRHLLKPVFALSAIAIRPSWAETQSTFPRKPVKIILPYAAGGVTDVAVRIVGQSMSEKLQQAFVIDNRPGANGLIAYKAAEAAAPDGYTLTMLSSSTSSSLAVMRRPNDINEKFKAVGNIYESIYVLIVDPRLPIDSIKDVVGYAKANPGAGYASIGIGSTGHMSMAALARREGLSMVHVPYRGGVLAVSDVAAGRVPMMYVDMGSASNFLKLGTVRPVAVSSVKRSPALPHVATAAEQGFPSLTAASFGGLAAPAGTADDRIAILTDALKEAMAQPRNIEKINGLNVDAVFFPPKQFSKALDDAYTLWRAVAEENHIVAE